MENRKNKIVQKITKMLGKYSPDVIFDDWVQLCAIAIQNACVLIHNDVWKEREEQYINIAKKYTVDEIRIFSEMFTILIDAFEENMSDILGEIYMEAGCGSKHTGQFFTPFHISYLIAELEIAHKNISENEKYEINEPSVGGGGMIIATAKVLKEKGINFKRCLRVTAQDLDWRSVYMAYVQLSILGIDAIVVQGDSLCNPYDERLTEERHILRTPKRMGVLI